MQLYDIQQYTNNRKWSSYIQGIPIPEIYKKSVVTEITYLVKDRVLFVNNLFTYILTH